MLEEPTPLAYTEWQLVELAGQALDLAADDRRPSLVFDLEESRVAGSGGVNRIMGTFALAQGELRFGPLGTTLMAGPQGAMERERLFLDALARVDGYLLEDGVLTLLAGAEPIARFEC